jgi:hypothetical protein
VLPYNTNEHGQSPEAAEARAVQRTSVWLYMPALSAAANTSCCRAGGHSCNLHQQACQLLCARGKPLS